MYIYISLHSHFKHANKPIFTDDNVSDERSYGSGRMNAIAYAYRTEKRQYEKALAWYLLSAKESNIFAPVRIGTLYFHGNGVPKNYLCALKWYLNAPRLNEIPYSLNEIGELFENGFGVPLDKYKALEWYIRLGDDAHIYRLKDQGYSQSAADKSKFGDTIDSLY
jgi:TPR repeat protein